MQLYKRNLFLYFSGRGISTFGDSLHKIALAWIMLELTGKATTLGNMLGLQNFAYGIFGLIAGVMADKFSRKKLIVISDFLQGLFVLAVLFIPAYFGRINQINIYIVALFYPFLVYLFYVSSIGFIAEITPDEKLPTVNSFSTFFMTSLAFLGTAVAGFIIKKYGYSATFLIDAITSLFAALTGAMIIINKKEKLIDKEELNTENKSYIAMLKEGFAEFKDNKVLTTNYLFGAIFDFFTPFTLWLPVAIMKMKGDSGLYGISNSFLVAGAITGGIIGSFILKKLLVKFNAIELNLRIQFSFGLLFLITSLFLNIYSLMIMMFVYGVIMSIARATSQTFIQTIIDNNKIGRVSSVITLAQTILDPIAFTVGGILLDIFPFKTMLSFYGVILILQMIIGFRIPVIRDYCMKNKLEESINDSEA